MRTIPLTQGQVAIVDDADFDLVSRYKWCALRSRHTFYAVSGGSPQFRMHRLILSARPDQLVDHRDGDGLNNARTNLRVCTHQQNQRNQVRARRPVKSSVFTGVHWLKRRKKWQARISDGSRRRTIGYFDDEVAAARAYDVAARAGYGEFASCNFPE